MNRDQRKYALERVDALEKQKLSALKEKHKLAIVIVDSDMRASLIRTGKVKLRADITSIAKYDDVVDVFDFSKFEQRAPYNEKALGPAATKVSTEAQRVRDLIMLGDAAEALALLADFDSK